MWALDNSVYRTCPLALSKSNTLNFCHVLWMVRKAVGPMCCVTHVKVLGALIEKEKGFAPVFLAVAAECAVAPCKPLYM